MLILYRKHGQGLVLHTQDGEITVKVIRSDRDPHRLLLGIDAPESVTILRSEVQRTPLAEALVRARERAE